MWTVWKSNLSGEYNFINQIRSYTLIYLTPQFYSQCLGLRSSISKRQVPIFYEEFAILCHNNHHENLSICLYVSFSKLFYDQFMIWQLNQQSVSTELTGLSEWSSLAAIFLTNNANCYCKYFCTDGPKKSKQFSQCSKTDNFCNANMKYSQNTTVIRSSRT